MDARNSTRTQTFTNDSGETRTFTSNSEGQVTMVTNHRYGMDVGMSENDAYGIIRDMLRSGWRTVR